MRRQFPKYMRHMPRVYRARHGVLIPAFIGTQARLFSIFLELTPDRSGYSFDKRSVIPAAALAKQLDNPPPPRVALGGCGLEYMASMERPRRKRWLRRSPTRNCARERDRGRQPCGS
jgi:hypothetical protein